MSRGRFKAHRLLGAGVCLSLALCLGACNGSGRSGGGSEATSLDPPAGPEPPGEAPAFPFVDHVDQAAIAGGRIGFRELFVLGDEIFGAAFNSLDGVGALRLPEGGALPGRFSRLPPGGGRFTGPNAQACEGCHNDPFGTSAGSAASNVLQDPARAGLPPFNARNTISLFGSGMVQRLAEEMTEELLSIRDAALAAALPGGAPVERELRAKGIAFGAIRASRDAAGNTAIDASAVRGVSPDLVVRPFGWKGDVPTLRVFTRGAARNELGIEADELVERDPSGLADPDGDGVEGELSVGDVTAMTVYIAAQETPASLERLARDGLLAPPGQDFSAAADRGRALFEAIGCAECHAPELRLNDPVFEEPTRRGGGGYLDGDLDPATSGYDPERPFRFHLGRQGDLPRPEPHAAGGLRVRLFGDLRRHRMGGGLADPQETPVLTAESRPLVFDGAVVKVDRLEFLTPELWGVGSTGPWLHDGRAASLEEAVLLHGEDSPPVDPLDRSEAQEARDRFTALGASEREDLVTFLRSLVLFESAEE
jgi:hypothetical protein